MQIDWIRIDEMGIVIGIDEDQDQIEIRIG
jgi:hypothetical protein